MVPLMEAARNPSGFSHSTGIPTLRREPIGFNIKMKTISTIPIEMAACENISVSTALRGRLALAQGLERFTN